MNVVLLTIFAIHLVTGDVNEKNSLAISRVASNFPGLQAPFEGSATSPQRRRIISTHHNADDENNLERLCNDPFHSFLCKPVGPRKKRIDGRLRPGVVLPPGVVAAASNLREEKQPLEEGSALLSASLNDDRMYLPPLSKPPPVPKSEAQYLPPTESKPNVETVPSSPPNFYLPVFDATQQPSDQVKNSVNQDEIKKYISFKPPTVSYLPTNEKLLNPAEVQLSPFSTNQDEVKVPQNIFDSGDESKPENTELIPNIEGGSLLADEIKTNSNNDKESHTLERLCNDPFHSFLCKPVKKRKRIDGNIRQGAKLPTNFLLGSSSIRREARVLPPNVGMASLSANTPSNNYVAFNSYKSQSPGEQNQFQQVYNEYSEQREPTKYLRQFSTQSPLLYSYNFQKHGHSIATNQKLNYYKNSSVPSHPRQDNDHLNVQYYKDSASHLQNAHYHSVFSQTAKSQYEQSTEGVKKSQTNRQPSLQQGKLISSNQKRYTYQEHTPQYTFTNIHQPYEDKQFIGPYYKKSDPTNIQQRFINPEQNGYIYNKPQPIFTYPTSPSGSSTTQTNAPIQQNPTNIQPTFVNPQQNGYQYNKPSTLFTYPTTPPRVPTEPTTSAPFTQTTTKPATYPTSTTRKPVIIQQNPTNVQPTFVNPQQNGYQYNKPSTLFTYPTTSPRAPTAPTTSAPFIQTTIRPATYPTSTTRKPVIIQQNPTNVQPTFVNPQQNGYQYNKPSTLFTYPTTPPRAPTAPTTRVPFVQTTTIRPVTYLTSTTRKPVIIQQNPTNVQPTFVNPQQNGYQYNKPSTLFTYPTTPPRAPTAPTTRVPFVQTTTIRPVTYLTSTTRKPVIIQQNPTNVQPTFVNPQQNGYQYNKPSTLFTYPTTSPRAPTAPTTRAPFVQTTTIRPVTYPTSTTRKPVIIQQNPTNVQPTFVNPQQNGYQYNKPSTLFTYPTTNPRAPTAPTTRAPFVQTTTTRPATYPTSTTRKPVIIQQNPTNVQPTFVNLQQNGYQYNKPSTLFTYPTTPPRAPTAPTTRAPFVQTTTIRPATYPTSRTRKPVIIQQNPTNVQPTFVNPQQNGYQYNKPSTLFTYPTTPPRAPTAPTTRAPFVQTTTIRPATYPTSTTRKPVIIQQNPTNVQPTFVNPQQNGYQYNKPSTLFTYPTTPPRAPTAPTTRAPFVQTTTIRPATYPTSTTRKPVIIQQNPTNVQPTFVNPQQNGYQYNKPSTLFTYPTTPPRAPTAPTTRAPFVQTTTIRPVTYPTRTTPKPVVIQQNPTIVQPTFVNPQQNGYQYNKPSTLFTYPTTPPRAPTVPTTRAPFVQTTTIRPVTYPTSTTRMPVIIQQNPTNVQPTFVNPQQNGYQYNKPSTSFTYPTTPPRAPTAPTTGAPFVQTTTIRPLTYPTSTTRKPVIIQQNPTNIQPTFLNPQQNGYQYNKPSAFFTYPTSPPAISESPTSNVPYSSQNLGYDYPKPPNQVFLVNSFRSSTHLPVANSYRNLEVMQQRELRFGERLKPRIPFSVQTVTSNYISR